MSGKTWRQSICEMFLDDERHTICYIAGIRERKRKIPIVSKQSSGLVGTVRIFLFVTSHLRCSKKRDMVASSISCGTTNAQTLFDFTRIGLDNALGSWTENSDTTKNTGMSKAAFVLQKSQVAQRAILFTLLNPRKNGTEYAAVQCDANFNIADFNNICLRCRGQGANLHYKMLLRHKSLEKSSLIYGQVFTAPVSEFSLIKLPLNAFKPYYRGQELSLEDNPLDSTAITSIGLKVDKGPYLPDNQDGVAALEIDWIKATK